MESAISETAPELQEAPNSMTNIAALSTSATHSALRYPGSTTGAEHDDLEQQEADMFVWLPGMCEYWKPCSRYRVKS